MNKILEKYKSEVETQLHSLCRMFCTIGFPHESPRWINIDSVYEEKGIYFMKFMSTQTETMWFTVEISEEDYKFLMIRLLPEYMWADFKEFRTNFLKEYYPTISRV